MTRTEHIEWCKKRALAYLPEGPQAAFTSMMSDLGKHDETANHIGVKLGMQLISGDLKSVDGMRAFIEGFN